MTAMRRGHHRCPCGCGGAIPDQVFSCRSSWPRLPMDLRVAIVATRFAPLTDPDRAALVHEAVEFFRTHPTTRGRI